MVSLNKDRSVYDVHPDDPLWYLWENNIRLANCEHKPEEYNPRPPVGEADDIRNMGLCRVQEVQIMRGQVAMAFQACLGPAENYNAMPLDVTGGIVTDSGRIRIFVTAGQAMEMAQKERHRALDDGTIEHYETTPLVFPEQIEEAIYETNMRAQHISVFGPMFRKQR